MKFRSLLLFSTFSSAAIFFLFSALLPSPSLAANHCTGQDRGCMRQDKCINPDTGTSFFKYVSEQCTTIGTNFICCVTGSGPKPCEADNSCLTAPLLEGTDPTSALCGTGANLNKGVNTAIGCLIAGDPKVFISQLLGWGVGVGGGIAFLMIVFAGFQMVTASGDPKRVQAAKELLTSAIAGLILIVLSVLLLNFIGVKILHLPGFTV